MRLAVYGTLRRGAANHHVVAGIAGTWATGTVRGWVYELGWGPAEGYPGLTLDPAGAKVPVDVLAAEALDRHLDRLDRFEGDGYRRVVAPVTLDDGEVVEAWVYEAIAES